MTRSNRPVVSPQEAVEQAVARVLDRATAGCVLAAVSGGSDSVALLHALRTVCATRHRRLIVAHLNHTVRGDQADADEAFVRRLAAEMNLLCIVGRWEPGRSSHFEEDARRARHRWLHEIACSTCARLIMMGHTRDDQAETILYRVARGCGLRGLAGIPARRRLGAQLHLVRPFLDLPRSTLRAYLEAQGQTWREDPSNEDPTQTRARIRHHLLPALAQAINPRTDEALTRLARLAGNAERQIAAASDALAALGLAKSPGPPGKYPPSAVCLDRALLRDLQPHLRSEVVRAVWRSQGWPQRGMDARSWRKLGDALRHACDPFDAGHGIRCISDEQLLVLVPVEGLRSQLPPAPVALPLPGRVSWGACDFTAAPAEGPGLPCHFERIDSEAVVPFPTAADGRPTLVIRGWCPGDRFDPLGLGGHRQNVADLLRARGVAARERPQAAVVLDQRGIIWVVGHRIAERVRWTDSCRLPLYLTCRTQSGGSNPAT